MVIGMSSPKYWESTAAAAPLAQECADGYSGNGGVGMSGVQFGSAIVSGLLSVSAKVIAVIGRQNAYVYFASQQPIMASDMARFTCASSRAVRSKLNWCCSASE